MTAEKAGVKVNTNTIFIFIVLFIGGTGKGVSCEKSNGVGNQECFYPFGTQRSPLRPGGMVGRRESLMCLLQGDADNAAMISRVFLDEGGVVIWLQRGRILVREPVPALSECK